MGFFPFESISSYLSPFLLYSSLRESQYYPQRSGRIPANTWEQWVRSQLLLGGCKVTAPNSTQAAQGSASSRKSALTQAQGRKLNLEHQMEDINKAQRKSEEIGKDSI